MNCISLSIAAKKSALNLESCCYASTIEYFSSTPLAPMLAFEGSMHTTRAFAEVLSALTPYPFHVKFTESIKRVNLGECYTGTHGEWAL